MKSCRAAGLLLLLIISCCRCGTAAASAFCFIGDSRFVGMDSAVPMAYRTNVGWLAETSVGNRWFWNYGEAIKDLSRDTVIVYGLGVNDLDSVECVSVLTYLRDLGFQYIYFVAAGPVDEAKAEAYGYTRTNRQIMEYNQEVYANLPDGVGALDSYVFLMSNGFDTWDGIHYKDETYQIWFYALIGTIDSLLY